MAIILDNSNLNESYAGVTTPLTFSFAKRIYTRVYRQFCQMMGVSQQAITENDEYFQNMLATVGGRMYYNLSSWHHMIGLLPAYTMNSAFLEQMMGIESEHQGKVAAPSYSTKVFATVTTVYIVLRTIFIFLAMPFWHRHFTQRFNYEYQRLSTLLKQDLPLKHMMQYYLEAEEVLTRDFRIPIVNDFAVMISTGIIKKKHASIGEQEELSFRAHAGVKSAEPGLFIAQLVELIRSKPEYVELFRLKNSTQYILEKLPDFPELQRDIEFYKQEYGYRVPGELKLESLTFMNDSGLLITFLQRQVAQAKVTQKAKSSDTETRTQKSFLPWHLRWVESWAEHSITRREQTRFQRTLIFGLARDTFLKVGEVLHAQKYLDDARDVFYLSVDELVHSDTTEECQRYKKLVEERKKKNEYYQKLNVPSHLVLDEYPLSSLAAFEVDDDGVQKTHAIKGQVASTADLEQVTGEALVLDQFDQQADFHNKILITHQTDPGWTIIFPFLKGIVVERGGLLSHAAIVAREFNIPCIINAKDATAQVPAVSVVTLDLKKGDVTWTKK